MWFLEYPIAHRGLHDKKKGIPENSLLSFELAITKGYPIELDVHLTADDEIVVFHDRNLKRMTGLDGLTAKMTTNSLKKIKLNNSNQNIPTFKEALEFINGKVLVLIEIKNRGKVGKLESALLRLLETYHGDLALQSFNPYSLSWFKKNRPEYFRGQIAGDFKGEDLFFFKKIVLRNLLLNNVSKPHFISYDIRALPYWAVTYWEKKGMPIIGWTVKNRNDKEKAKCFCDNYIFENIDPNIEK